MSQPDFRLPPANPADVRAAVSSGVGAALPGSAPDRVSAAARALRANAAALRSVLAQVRRLGQEQSFWTGSAAEEFGRIVAQAPNHIDSVCARYEGYATILDEYVAILVLVRAGIPRRQRQLYEAGRLLTACSTPPEQQRAGDGCLAVYALLRGEYEAVYFAAQSAARKLHRLDDTSALQNPQGWHALANSASGVFETLSKWSAELGLLAILVCPAAAPLFFAAAAAFSAAQLATDVVRSTTLGEHVSFTRYAEATIGVVPFTGLAKAGVAGVRAARAGEGIASGAARGGAAALKSVSTGAVTEAREGVRELSQLEGRQWLSVSDRVLSFAAHTEDVLSFGYDRKTGTSPVAATVHEVAARTNADTAAGGAPRTGEQVPVAVRVGEGPGLRRVTITIPLPPGPAVGAAP
ncbi:MAG: hypothetical protein JWM76_1330 [Pseudonocardiales bacterium]|nr:hypothetical protein [Pseudonocardiales bacterium]